MPSSKRAEDLRESYRCSVDAPQQSARLRAGGVWSPVILLDESRGGFGVLAPGLSGIAVGDLVQLRTASECFEAEVMHIMECPSTGDQEQPALRLGLKRVRELFVDSDQPLPWHKRILAPWRRAPHGAGRTTGMVGFVFALLVGVIPILAIILMERHEIADLKADSVAAGKRDGKPTKSLVSRFDAPEVRPTPRPTSPTATIPDRDNLQAAASSLDRGRYAEWLRLLERAKLQADLGQWNDAVMATIARITERITLSPTQQTQIAELLQHADEALARLAASRDDTAPDQIADQRSSILETAYARLMQLLTDAQKVQWADVLRESDEASKPKGKESP